MKYIWFGTLFFNLQLISGQTHIDSVLKPLLLQEVKISKLHVSDSLRVAPASIGVLSRHDLARNNNTDIALAANRIPGVYMQSANFTTTRISIRGIGARTTYGTNKIRAFYGSIPLTSGNSETVIDDLDLENLDQVEIIKGPLSSVYGAGLGGAILISPKLSESPGQKASINSTHGSFGLMKNSVNYHLDKKSASLHLNYHHQQTDGWRQNSEYVRDGFTLGGELFRKAHHKLTYLSNYTYLKAFVASSINRKTFDENPRAAAPTWLASKGYKEYRSALNGLGYDFRLSKNIANTTSVFLNYKDNYETRPFNILREYTFAGGGRTQFTGNFEIAELPLNVIAGVEYFADNYQSKTIENLYQQNNNQGSLEGNQLTGTRQSRNFYNAFAQLRVILTRKFEIQSGININKTRFSLKNTFPEAAVSSDHYQYDAIYSPQFSLLFKPGASKTFYVSASRGYSLPSVIETLTASGTINANIQPESGYNYEIGGKCYFLNKTLYTELSVYRMQIKDLLVAKRIGDDRYVGVNAGKTLHQGIEFSVNHLWQISRLCELQSSVGVSVGEYRFEDFTDSGTDFSNNKLTGVPAHKVNAGMVLSTFFGWYLSADYQYVAEVPLNDANSEYSDAYQIVNLKSGWRFELLPGLVTQVAAGVNNLFDRHYAALILPNAVGVGNAQPRYFYPGLPVNYYASVGLHYTF